MFVVNKSQQVTTAGMAPKAAYSRVVSLHVDMTDDDLWQWALTPKLGNSLWLYEVKVWVLPFAINQANRVQFEVRGGGGAPNTQNEFMNWQNILPLYDENGAQVSWEIYDGNNSMAWSMARHYQGESLRFGIIASRTMAALDSIIWASFHISEG